MGRHIGTSPIPEEPIDRRAHFRVPHAPCTAPLPPFSPSACCRRPDRPGGAHAQEREWTLDASDQEAYLIFGVADTDDVGVSLWCPAKKGVVNLFVPRPTAELQKLARHQVPMTVKAGTETATFAGKIEINPDAPNSSVEVEMPVDTPAAEGHAIGRPLQRQGRFPGSRLPAL